MPEDKQLRAADAPTPENLAQLVEAPTSFAYIQRLCCQKCGSEMIHPIHPRTQALDPVVISCAQRSCPEHGKRWNTPVVKLWGA